MLHPRPSPPRSSFLVDRIAPLVAVDALRSAGIPAGPMRVACLLAGVSAAGGACVLWADGRAGLVWPRGR